jgi:trans-aconitate 2-methyltransferase
MTTVRWDPQQYVRYADERGRPFHDLLARVAPDRPPSSVVDLGCGPGTLTATLAQRWPEATVTGVDSSAEMIEECAAVAGPRLRFVRADLRSWTPDRPVDVIVSNATLQWVPDHLALLPTLIGALADGGLLALQVPGNFHEPSHTLLRDLRESPRWRDLLGRHVTPDLDRAASVGTPQDYLAALAGAGCRADVWETTYLHLLSGPDPVLEWMRGTGARPTLAALPPDAREEFEREYAGLLRAAYPEHDHGTVLPFRRIFAVARRP